MAGSNRKYRPIPTSSREMKAVKEPKDNQSKFSEVMKAIRMTNPAESRKSVPPTEIKMIPTSCLGSMSHRRRE